MAARPSRYAGPSQPAPSQLAGFDHIKRYWDRSRDSWVARVLPGEYYVTGSDELIMTVLGSCVSACVRDRVLGLGGMNHFMLPEHLSGDTPMWAGTPVNAATRFGGYAMEHLINDILSRGGRRQHLELKIVGGGKILPSMTDVGNGNVRFIQEYARVERLEIVGEDVGDIYPRKVVYAPASGCAWVKRLGSIDERAIIKSEQDYRREVERAPVTGGVELF
jgi:chemotaxis protein CheD